MAVPPALPSARLDRYELSRVLASNDAHAIYEARAPYEDGVAVRLALKRVQPLQHGNPRLLRTFCERARLQATLSHPNIVTVVKPVERIDEPFFVMEYVDGLPLSQVLTALSVRKRSADLGPSLFIASEVARALVHAHESVLHRELAPGHVLIDRAGRVMLTDFGVPQPRSAEPRPVRGREKLAYRSPEQAVGRSPSVQSDLFSLGVLLAELLQGAPLVAGAGAAEIFRNLQSRNWASLSAVRAFAPASVVRLVSRLLAHEPAARPASAASVLTELLRLARERGVRLGAGELSAWLADLGVIRLDSAIRERPPPPPTNEAKARAKAVPLAPSAKAPRILTQSASSSRATVIDPEESTAPHERPSSSELRYRLRRPGGEILGPLTLGRILGMIATARAGLDSELARDDGPFLALSRAFELTRLAARQLYRFFDPIALLASERHVVERGTLAGVLLRLALSRRTGLLVHRFESRQHRVYFEAGAPTASASTEPAELLGERLSRAGLVKPADLERVLESGYRSGCAVGESLVRSGRISQEQLLEALVTQRLTRLTRVAEATTGELFFIEGATPGEAVLGVSREPCLAVASALRAAYTEDELVALLRGLDRTALSPSPACAELRSALGFTGEEAYAFDLVLRGAPVGLVLREAKARSREAHGAAAFALFVGLSAGAFVADHD